MASLHGFMASGSFPSLICGFSLTILVYFTYHAIYTVFFHPLSRYPGPKLAAISPIPLLFWEIRGKSHTKIKSLHDKYGDVVRIGPNALVYRSPTAWKDIYGHRKQGQKVFLKDPSVYTPLPNGAQAIITANEADHTRMRRLLSHAFSDRALRKQERLLHMYADLLVQKIHRLVESSPDAVDMTRWYNYTTFDLTGDMAFGEPFHCLRDSHYHWWVSIMIDAVKASSYLRMFWFFPFLVPLAKVLVPGHLVEKQAASFQLSIDRVDRRLGLKNTTDRPDFMSYILQHNTKDGSKNGMSRAEIDANAATLVLAGSETTAALLSGCTYYLLKTPAAYRRLVDEIRSAFQEESDINLSSFANMPYLNAVLEESLRIYPPIPAMLPRLVPEGGAAINDPDTFIPERWLQEPDSDIERFVNDKKEAFQPFSYGPRSCLGQHLANAEMRLILTKILWHFDLELSPNCDNWIDQETYNLWSRPALMVKLSRAQKGTAT
ncbi:hypothetical protein MW887_010912 [Aspergillus wentii]|nr:hypothetical protein MW887_010912 [Aspergillus wentii]